MEDYTYDPEPTESFLSLTEKKKCCDIMRSTGVIPTPAKENEIKAILLWLNKTKSDYPNLVCYNYKDCCFQKDNGVWDLSYKNNDLMFSEMLYGGVNLW